MRFKDSLCICSLFYILSAIYLYFVFSPAITIPFSHNDDYYYWLYDNRDVFGAHPQHAFLNIIGRGLYNILHYPLAKLIDVVSDLWILRTITVGIIALSMTGLSLCFYRLGFSMPYSFFVSAAIFTLPASQVFIFWASFGSYHIAGLFALISAFLAEGVDPKGIFSKKILRPGQLAFLPSSVLFFILSLYIYQPYTMLFFVPIFAALLFEGLEKWPLVRLKLLRNLGIFGSSSAIYFAIQKFYFTPRFMKTYPWNEAWNPNTGWAFNLSTDLWYKVNFFIKDLSFTSFNLWNIYPNHVVAYSVVAFILVGALLAGVRLFFNRQNSLKPRQVITYSIEIICAIFIMLLLANAPVLMASGGHGGLRLLFAYSSMIVLMIVWVLMLITSVFSEKRRLLITFCLLGIMTVGSGIMAQRNLLNTALSSNIELNFMRSKIQQNLDKLSAIHVIKPPYTPSFLNLPTAGDGEFNFPSSHSWPNVPWMIRAVLLELVEDKSSVRIFHSFNRKESVQATRKDGIVVTESFPGEPIYASPSALIIDMNELHRPGKKIPKLRAGEISITTSNNSEAYFLLNTLGTRSGWETSGPFPIWVQIAYPFQSKRFTGYSLITGDHPVDSVGRMPKDWVLEASVDGSDWVKIDERTEQTGWKVNEVRTYEIKVPGEYLYYRFNFTSGIHPAIIRIQKIVLF